MVLPGLGEALPETLFFNAANQFQGTPNQQQQIQSSFQPIHNIFQGLLGQQIQGGQIANASFADFLKGKTIFPEQPSFSFQNFLAQLPPSQRLGGLNATFLNPKFKFLPF